MFILLIFLRTWSLSFYGSNDQKSFYFKLLLYPKFKWYFFASNITFFLVNMGTTNKENKYIYYFLEEKLTGFTDIFFLLNLGHRYACAI